jgi:beta-lactam-binding protein with PASTA domain
MRADLQRAASGMPVAAAPPTRLDMYPQTQRMGTGTMMAGATSQIPPVEDYDYAGRGYDQGGRGGGGTSRRWIPWVLGLVLVIGVVAGVAYYLLAGGGKTYAVPLVNGEPVAQAQQQIQAQHLRSTVVDQASSGVKQGLVINSNPPEGNNVPANTVVTLFVSKGAAPVAVPNVVGQSETAAESALQSAGFKAQVKNDPTSSAPLGQVTAQSPSQGTAPPGSTVIITVSGGAVTVPSVVGDSQATANQILTQAGFQVSVQQGSGPAQYPNGTVFNQVPGNGSAAKGSTVTIYVQNGASATGSPSAPAPPPTTPAATGSGGGNGGGNGNGF